MGLLDDAAMGGWTAWQLNRLALHGASEAYRLAQELAAWAQLQPNHYPRYGGRGNGGSGYDEEEICQGYIVDEYDALGSGTLGLEAGAETAALTE